MNTKSEMSKYVWALGIYFGNMGLIMGLMMPNSFWDTVATMISGWLLTAMLLWTGGVLVSLTRAGRLFYIERNERRTLKEPTT